ncbi:YaaA family protein [Gammaproteobacteria bacterium]|nr:YaaA family protein [Gammaproteobacteria bacterium]
MIIISPAKKQVEHHLQSTGIPHHLEVTDRLASVMQGMDAKALGACLKISQPLAKLNVDRMRDFSIAQIKSGHTASAIHTYQGDVYQYLDVESLSEDEMLFLQQNVRMISAFYGLLKPLDGILPYRLEMVSRLPDVGDLSKLWIDRITTALKEEDIIFNLASNEYSKSVDRTQIKRWVDIKFLDETSTGYKTIAVKAKRMRGRLLRYMIQNKITQPEKLRAFSEQGYIFDEACTDENLIQFIHPAAS